jgi:hypothetical protein
VIASFLVDAERVLAGDESAWTGWPIFWAGMAVAAATTAAALGLVRRGPNFGRKAIDN